MMATTRPFGSRRRVGGHAAFQSDAVDVSIASSPAIWWNTNQVLQGEAAFAAAVRAGKTAPRILIAGRQQGGRVRPVFAFVAARRAGGAGQRRHRP